MSRHAESATTVNYFERRGVRVCAIDNVYMVDLRARRNAVLGERLRRHGAGLRRMERVRFSAALRRFAVATEAEMLEDRRDLVERVLAIGDRPDLWEHLERICPPSRTLT
jgi:hypothetical protein